MKGILNFITVSIKTVMFNGFTKSQMTVDMFEVRILKCKLAIDYISHYSLAFPPVKY